MEAADVRGGLPVQRAGSRVLIFAIICPVNPNHFFMLKHYLKITIRRLLRYKGYTFINVAGLAIGIAVCLLIGLFLQHELSYDRHHAHADRIFRVVYQQESSEQALTPELLAPALQEHLPDIDRIARLSKSYYPRVVSAGQRRFHEERFFHADSSFFSLFSYTFLQGNPALALVEPGSVVITASTAQKYFPARNPMGQALTYEGREYRVTGVMEDVPEASHFHFDFLARLEPEADQWFMYSAYTYVLLHAGANPEQVEEKLDRFVESTVEPQMFSGNYGRFRLQPLTRIHLYSNLADEIEPNSDVRYLYIFAAVALVLLLVACINYVIITTARSSDRSQEVGIRKTFGAPRSELIRQFIGESTLLTFAALLLGLMVTRVCLPVLNNLTGLTLSFLAPGGVSLLVFGLVVILLVGVIAGSYPAFYLSRFRPVHTLRDVPTGGMTRLTLRKTLVVSQFTASIVLLIVSIVMYNQLDYLRSKPLGFDKEHIVIISDWDRQLQSNYDSFKYELTRDPRIRRVAAGHPPNRSGGMFQTYTFEETQEKWLVRIVTGDFDYPETLGLTFISGESFSEEKVTDSTTIFIANELAMQQLHDEESIEASFEFWAGKGPIVGVVRDFHMRSLHEPIEPMLVQLSPGHGRDILVRIAPNDVRGALAAIEETWNRFTSDQPLAFAFLDDELNVSYHAEQRLARIFGIFASLVIFVACLGLFGLVALTAEQRTREIGIRKALGASVMNIVSLLLKDFLVLVLTALVVATPLAYFAVSRWLEGFSYRINPGAGTFLLVGVMVLIIALMTLSHQALRAALADPVKSLRYE